MINSVKKADKSPVVGIAGRIGSGKSTISKQLAQYLNWRRVGFGEYLRSVADKMGLPQTRESLQQLGGNLVEQDCTQFCRSLLQSVNWKAGDPLLIDGIRHKLVVAELKKIVEPQRLLLVFLEVNEATLQERRMSRNEIRHEEESNPEKHSTEKDVLSSLKSIADLVVQTELPPAEVIGQISSWLKVVGY